MLALTSTITRSWVYAFPVIIGMVLWMIVTGLAESTWFGINRLYARVPHRWRDLVGDAAAAFFGLVLILGIGVGMAACQAASDPPSPRELIGTAGNAYAAMLVATDAALGTGQIPADARGKIEATSRAATDAFHAATQEALKCQRINGAIVDATDYNPPDKGHCNPTLASLLLAGAKGAIGDTDALLGSYGYAPKVMP